MLIEKVLSTVRKYNMLKPGDKVLVAVSGGPDSMALLHALWASREQLSIELCAFHLDHMFRGDESRQDLEAVCDYCDRLGVQVVTRRYNVPLFAQESKLSDEEAARVIRYRIASSVAASLGCTCIALAHQRDDNLETVLMHLLRGSGLRGLAGIRPVRSYSSHVWSGKLIRPLLQCSRDEIEAYCREEGIPFRIDRSNLSDRYARNRIRLDLIPRLLEYNPNLSETVASMSEFVADEDDFLDEQARKLLVDHSRFVGGVLEVELEALERVHPALVRRAILVAIERVRGVRSDVYSSHIQSVFDLVVSRTRSGRLSLPGGTVVRKRYGVLEFAISDALESEKVPQYSKPVAVPGFTVVPYISKMIVADVFPIEQLGNRHKTADPSVAYMDYDVVSDGLAVRNRRDGDRFAPLGMAGTKKLKKFFIDNKIKAELRDRIPLIVYGRYGEHIAWVGELRLSENVKITGKTRNVLRLSLEPISGNWGAQISR